MESLPDSENSEKKEIVIVLRLKPDLTWNGKRRLFFCVPPVCFVSRRKPLGMVLDRKASPKLLNAPLASLAALARSLRSSTVVSFC